MAFELDLLRIVRAVVVILALVLSWLAFKGYRKKKDKSLLFISIGFGIIAGGTFVEGVLFEFFSYDLLTASLVESTVVALGLLFLVFAIYGVAEQRVDKSVIGST